MLEKMIGKEVSLLCKDRVVIGLLVDYNEMGVTLKLRDGYLLWFPMTSVESVKMCEPLS